MLDTGDAPYVDLSAFGNFSAYCSSFRSSSLRKMRQRRTRLEAERGPVSFEVLHGAAARAAVEQAIGWKRDWLKTRALASRVFDRAPNKTVLLEASESPAAHVSVLRAGGQPIAIELGFSCASHYAAYLGTFDVALAGYSPGQEQMLRTIEWCFAEGFSRYDLLAPADEYKRHWTRGGKQTPVRDYGLPLSRAGAAYLFIRQHATRHMKQTLRAVPPRLLSAAGRYGPIAAGAGATAAALSSLIGD
jgi:CelD/BcsL family acetyltransferase involved in cellulose biosynthesis